MASHSVFVLYLAKPDKIAVSLDIAHVHLETASTDHSGIDSTTSVRETLPSYTPFNPAPTFKEHLLQRRLERVPTTVLTEFWEKDIDFSDTRNRKEVVKKIVVEYQIKKRNPDFLNKFKNFIRDSVLTAREADYLIHISKPQQIIDWVQGWEQQRFIGQAHHFHLHTILDLNKRYLDYEDGSTSENATNTDNHQGDISFPSKVIFLIGVNQKETQELNGLETVSFHPTTEFEIILRDNLDLIEIRGPYKVVRDFVSTAILDKDNPMSAAKSYFIGEDDDVKNSLVKVVKQVISIDTLRERLDGAYKKLKGFVKGTKASSFEANLEDMRDVNEESHPESHAMLKEMLKNPVKGSISFKYNRKTYGFSVTKTGGLFFREYVPEEVVTYIIYKIKLSSSVQHGKQKL